jgi:hypothetical protein
MSARVPLAAFPNNYFNIPVIYTQNHKPYILHL